MFGADTDGMGTGLGDNDLLEVIALRPRRRSRLTVRLSVGQRGTSSNLSRRSDSCLRNVRGRGSDGIALGGTQ